MWNDERETVVQTKPTDRSGRLQCARKGMSFSPAALGWDHRRGWRCHMRHYKPGGFCQTKPIVEMRSAECGMTGVKWSYKQSQRREPGHHPTRHDERDESCQTKPTPRRAGGHSCRDAISCVSEAATGPVHSRQGDAKCCVSTKRGECVKQSQLSCRTDGGHSPSYESQAQRAKQSQPPRSAGVVTITRDAGAGIF